MKTSILALAVGVVLGCPVASYAAENSNVIEGLFLGLDHSHRGYRHRATRSRPAEPTG